MTKGAIQLEHRETQLTHENEAQLKILGDDVSNGPLTRRVIPQPLVHYFTDQPQGALAATGYLHRNEHPSKNWMLDEVAIRLQVPELRVEKPDEVIALKFVYLFPGFRAALIF